MYARSTTIHGSTAAIDSGIGYMQEEAMPAVQAMPGCTGLSLLVDRDTGLCIATSAWTDEESMRASADAIHPMRERLVASFGGEPEVQEWEIAVLHREHAMHDSGAARVIWGQVDSGQMDSFLEAWKTDLMPHLQELPGFCSLSMLCDRRGERVVGTVTFHGREEMLASREQGRMLRDRFTGRMRGHITDMAEMDVALAHLRVPETV
jgi:quinol monooxygenase YgiN